MSFVRARSARKDLEDLALDLQDELGAKKEQMEGILAANEELRLQAISVQAQAMGTEAPPLSVARPLSASGSSEEKVRWGPEGCCDVHDT